MRDAGEEASARMPLLALGDARALVRVRWPAPGRGMVRV
jgi:hypothetical protein